MLRHQSGNSKDSSKIKAKTHRIMQNTAIVETYCSKRQIVGKDCNTDLGEESLDGGRGQSRLI